MQDDSAARAANANDFPEEHSHVRSTPSPFLKPRRKKLRKWVATWTRMDATGRILVDQVWTFEARTDRPKEALAIALHITERPEGELTVALKGNRK